MHDVIAPNARDANRLRLLQTLLRDRARSRADLGRALGLSRATVTLLLSELERAGMIEQQQADDDAEGQPRAIGRPPLQVSLARDAAFAIGLDLGHRHVRAAICDLGGGIVSDRWCATDVDDHPVATLDLARRLTCEALSEADVDASRVIGVGVGLAAPVDTATGTVHSEGILPGWSGVRPAMELERRLGLRVQVENDANAGAMGELLFGAGRGNRDMVYLRLSAGVGVGLIIDGRPYRGVGGIAGEVGHIPVADNGLICRCGNRGCLETVASPVAVADLLARSGRDPLTTAGLLQLVREGDRGACRAVADAGDAVGRIVAAIVNLLNPGLVVIGGELAGAGDVLLDPIRSAVGAAAIAPAARNVKVTSSRLGERAEVLGAAAIQLAHAPEALAVRLARA